MCRDYKKSFVAFACSIADGTRKSFYGWDKYIGYILSGDSLNKCALKCGIYKNTAFVWKYRILDVLQKMIENVNPDGIIEADETFFAISYKENHSKDHGFAMTRASHTRGHMTKLKCLSHENVCAPCAMNISECSIARISNLVLVN